MELAASTECGVCRSNMSMLNRVALVGLVCASALAGAAIWTLLGDLPSPEALITRSSPNTTKILDRQGRLLYEVLDPRAGRRTRVPLSELPVSLRQAVIAVEDANFYGHPGVDVVGVVRAVAQALRAGEFVSGGSTITQQLARDLLMSSEERERRTVTRKAREMFLALRLTQAYSKDAILESYLNEVYFGELAYGVEAAAQTYFGKPAQQLDLAESALLAGIIQSPAAYDPLVDLDAALARQRTVLGLMVKQGFVSSGEADLALSEPLHFVGHAPAQVLQAPHFVGYVRSLLEARYGADAVNRGGLIVTTTLDIDLQRQAEAVVRQRLAELARRTERDGEPDYNVHDAALVALEPATGQILAMVGSADYFDTSIDGAVNVALANRQPGSAIKPVTYAAAFSRGFTPATVVADVPTTFITKEGYPYAPENYDRQWHGPISLRQALATSSNMVAVRVLDQIGLPAMLETARALGITTFDDPDRFGLALTLGGGEVTLLELTAAYAAFANHGCPMAPTAILAVQLGAGQVQMPGGGPALPCAVSPQVAYLITDILSDDLARMPAFGEGSVLQLSRPAAAKTGTTTDFRDNWTLGYTPDLAVGVWAGNADNQPMFHSSGITGAGPIWHDFMEAALAERPLVAFGRPDGLLEVAVCETSGLLPSPDCPRVRHEIFIAGTEPRQVDDTYRRIALDSRTGLLWKDGCAGTPVERVYRLLQPEVAEWGRRQGIPEPPSLYCDGEPATMARAVSGAASAPSAARLAVTYPDAGASFGLSAQIPAHLQRVEIVASAAADIKQVELFVDGVSIGRFSGPPYRALWPLALGDHRVRAVGRDSAGGPVQSAMVSFHVVSSDVASQ